MTDKRGLYIHIPFCKKKCAYCSFNSYDNLNHLIPDYTDALIKQINSLPIDEIDSVYIGGGTPSAVDAKYIEKIMNSVFSHFNVSQDAEITIEINPGTVSEEKLVSYKNAGINRISIGSQDFSDEGLKSLGRIHTAKDTEDAVNLVKKCGFSNFSLDLMYGISNQTIESLNESLKKAISLNPNHISTYALSIDEGTPLYESVKSGHFKSTTDEAYEEMYKFICAFLKENGYVQYELSNFAKEGYNSYHNTKYWKCLEYYGVGAGASGYIQKRRYTNEGNIKEYIENPLSFSEDEILTKEDEMKEFVILGLRLKKGISKEEFSNKFSEDIYSVFENELKKHIETTKLICDEGGRIFLNEKAYFISNYVLSDFI